MKTKSFRKYAEKRLGKDAVDEIEVEALSDLDIYVSALAIRSRRLTLGISQSELARRSGLTSAAISIIEHGGRTPTLDSLSKLSNVFKVSVGALLNGGECPRCEGLGQKIEHLDFEKLDAGDRALVRKFINRLLG